MKIERIHLRDINTKKVKLYFKSPGAAIIYYNSMRFRLRYYYEMWDSKLNKIIEN